MRDRSVDSLAPPCPSFLCEGRVRRSHYGGLFLAAAPRKFDDFPAIEWTTRLENRSSATSPLVEALYPLDLVIDEPRPQGAPYVLHYLNGAPSDETDFEIRKRELRKGEDTRLSARGGRSSNGDFPFFHIETGSGLLFIAIGWSGQWSAEIRVEMDGRLQVRAGQEHVRFRLRPAECVSAPRILLMWWTGPQDDAFSAFRQLIYRYYVPDLAGQRPEPTLYCNTCFTRKGAWLNECTAENQISLINALSGLGVEAVVTDAGWFEGGWPEGAGNWSPRSDAYPDGMAPVAAAAATHRMKYGLWFELERVVRGSCLEKEHPEWLLYADDDGDTALLNLAFPRVREYLMRLVSSFMELPGFDVFRQDFNMDPLPFWRDNDAPEREGITEIRYVEGLYAWWDSLVEEFPESFRINCASGGRRIDLESISRFHVHQKSDYWFDPTVDQTSLCALSRYLPSVAPMAPLDRTDDLAFHSVLACSLNLGWIADGEGFDRERAAELVNTYFETRGVLNARFHPLTECTRASDKWLASQYACEDGSCGVVLVFRREHCDDASLQIGLKGLDESCTYEVVSERGGVVTCATGRELSAGLNVSIARAPGSALIRYRLLEETKGTHP